MNKLSDMLYFGAAALFFIGGGMQIGREIDRDDAEKAATIAATAAAVLLVAANAVEK